MERFLSRIKKTETCWIWTGAKQGNGYGAAWFNKKYQSAHRAMYLLVHGDIPPGLVIDHLCENKICVNPDHLEAVTQRENVRRWSVKHPDKRTGAPREINPNYWEIMPKKDNVRRGLPRTHCIYGHELSPSNVYPRKDGRRRCKKCAGLYRDYWRSKQRALRQSIM